MWFVKINFESVTDLKYSVHNAGRTSYLKLFIVHVAIFHMQSKTPLHTEVHVYMYVGCEYTNNPRPHYLLFNA